MTDKELIASLEQLKVQTGSLVCLGCGREHDCGIHGCAILRDELETAYDSISQLDGANSSLMAANEKLAADRKALINELCQYCGKYNQAHDGACDGCRWRDM